MSCVFGGEQYIIAELIVVTNINTVYFPQYCQYLNISRSLMIMGLINVAIDSANNIHNCILGRRDLHVIFCCTICYLLPPDYQDIYVSLV